MNRSDPRLEELCRLSAALRATALARLAAANAELNRTEAELEGLAAARQGQAIGDIAMLAASGSARALWLAARRRALSSELELAQARRAACAQEARRAVGRAQAIERLVQKGR
ncbi:hypothetical protein EV663_106133 [Rhodovulum bhavnagarense]|uniref:Uncharacterized protein n=1 Tax=Rhodovulum bhavnagarense TaxID=992286 RepID=A0A4R2RPR7_9RHOB|nr:hypothetical protein [Rhodovulum bhavnagarense]TCP61185.1 hypothetical protein EV663_106133 [Rhodovulum bhavnagarense]